MNLRLMTSIPLVVGMLLAASPGSSGTRLELGDVVPLSSEGGAAKPKLVRLPSGRLVAAYGDFLPAAQRRTVYDVAADRERTARDIFLRSCHPAVADCSDPAAWSAPLNLSGSAARSSMLTDWTGSTDASDQREPYPGDSDKPNLFSSGNRVVVTWTDKYCPDGDPSSAALEAPVQRSVTYAERDGREIPFSCLYAAASGDGGASWSPAVQLTSGLRDAKQDVNRGLGTGPWAIVWQEDPLGLQLGEAEGPGDGASGARASNGTDIWYTWAAPGWADDDAGAFGPWHAPARLTDNATRHAAGEHDLIRDVAGSPVPDDAIDGGVAGASRPALALQSNPVLESRPQALVAYEETKASAGLDAGKFVRYQTFPWDAPASAAGCIVSDPALNARRARVVAQNTPGPVSGLRLVLLWREGAFTQGGPADIRLRKGLVDGGNGFTLAELDPPVALGCATSDYATAIALAAPPGLNLSSRTGSAAPANDATLDGSTLMDHTAVQVEENALAHRAQLRGDDLYLGYGYTPDLDQLIHTNTANYNFYLRRYDAALGYWAPPRNVSRITDTTVNMREPRLLATPGSGPGCADPTDPADPEQCRDPSLFFVAWGTQTNVLPSSLEPPRDLALSVARGERRGVEYSAVAHLGTVDTPALDDGEESESQLRPTPAGNRVYAVWTEQDATGSTRALFRELDAVTVAETGASQGDDDGPFGCVHRPGASLDPTLPAVLLGALAALGRRRWLA